MTTIPPIGSTQASAPRTVTFEKWEGLGNDFVIVVGEPLWSDEEVRRVCDRRRGVGADGVLFVSVDSPRMIVRNADGSRPEMCGNGLRCVAAFLSEATGERAFSVATDAGAKRCEVTPAGDQYDVAIEMGAARVTGSLAWDDRVFTTVDVGNPHAISFAPFDEPTVDRVGPAVEVTPTGGTNVEFCRWNEAHDRIDVVVWERGVGRTLACGTGACAVAAAACAEGAWRFEEPITVRLPGGDLEITVRSASNAARLRGPARRAFRGAITL